MRQPSCASSELLGSVGSPSLPEIVSLAETSWQAVMSNHSAAKMRMGKIDPIFTCIMPHSVQSGLAASPSQLPMRKEGHFWCLLDATYRTGCLCASTLGQLHHGLQTGIGFLTYFTFQETVSHCEEAAEPIFDPKTIS